MTLESSALLTYDELDVFSWMNGITWKHLCLFVYSSFSKYLCYDMVKHMTKSNLERTSFISAYSSTSQSINEGNQAGTQTGQEPGDRRWCRGHGRVLFFIVCSAFSLIAFKAPSPESGTTNSKLGPHTSIISWEDVHRLVHRPVWWGHFLNWGSFF